LKTKIQIYGLFFSVLAGIGYFVFNQYDALEKEKARKAQSKTAKSKKKSAADKNNELKKKLGIVQKVADSAGMGKQFEKGVDALTKSPKFEKNLTDEGKNSNSDGENTKNEEDKLITHNADAAKIEDNGKAKWWQQSRRRRERSNSKNQSSSKKKLEDVECPVCKKYEVCEREKENTPLKQGSELKGDIQLLPDYDEIGNATGIIVSNQGFTSGKYIFIKSTFSKPLPVKVVFDIEEDPKFATYNWIQKIYPVQFESYQKEFPTYFPPGIYEVLIYKKDGVADKYSLNIKHPKDSFIHEYAVDHLSNSTKKERCKESIAKEINSLLRDIQWLSKAEEKTGKERLNYVAPIASRLNGISEELKYSVSYKDELTQSFVVELLNLRVDLINETKRLTLPEFENAPKMDKVRWRKRFEAVKTVFNSLTCESKIDIALNLR
jgi:hypothetical protein